MSKYFEKCRQDVKSRWAAYLSFPQGFSQKEKEKLFKRAEKYGVKLTVLRKK